MNPESANPDGTAARRVPSATLSEPREPWALRIGLSVSVWTLAGVATLLAASGQISFAHWVGITDIRAYAVPAVLELVAIAFLLIGYRRARRGDSPGAMWLLAAAVGGFAVYTNVAHSGRAGLVFGAASAVTLILWFVKLRDDYRHFQRHTGQATRPKPKFGALWLVAPRLTARAWIVAARRRISTVDESIAYAEIWRAVFEDARAAKVRRGLARRTAWRTVTESSGGVWAELPRTAEVAAVDVVRRDSGSPASHEPRPEPRPPLSAPPPTPPSAPLPAQPPAPPSAPLPVPPPAPLSVPPRTPLSAHPGATVSSNGASGQTAAYHPQLPASAPSLRDRVFAFLDEQFEDPDEVLYIDDDDPYINWMVARALDVDTNEVAHLVSQWRDQKLARIHNGAWPVSP